MASIQAINEWVATKITNSVSTMTCAYIFGLIAIFALPQAIHDSFANGFAPLPLVTWISQAFLQLVLLSIIMVGQTIQGRTSETRAEQDHNALMEAVKDLRHIMTEEDTSAADIAEVKTQLDAIASALNVRKL